MALARIRRLAGRRTRIEQDGPEWVGGRVETPFYITEDTPYRPHMILWLEMPGAIVVSYKLIRPEDPRSALGAALLAAIESPLNGEPRRPATVRVADQGLAAEVRPVLPGVPIVVAPTPEIGEVLDFMAEASADEGGGKKPSYFEGGRVGPDAVKNLFTAARTLHAIAPWKVAGDSQILRVDIPAYGVEGACLSIIGALGESTGLILFPSLEGFERFIDLADAPRRGRRSIDLGSTILSLNYEAGSELPPSMFREALEHGWPVANAGAYPLVQHRDRDGLLRPLEERDVRIMSASATSLVAFFLKHGSIFGEDVFDPICESYFDQNDLEVRFTVPYEAAEEFAVNAPGNRAPVVGRNQPCPCGSGRKYKQCCLRRGETARGPAAPPDGEDSPAPIHELDRKLASTLDRFARDRFGPGWMAAAAGAFRDPSAVDQLLPQWAIYHEPVAKKPVVEWFLDERADRLQGEALSWLHAQRAAWLSVWEVTAVEPGRSLTLSDLLTGENRIVRETSASGLLAPRDAILARVVDHEGATVLCGVHPSPMPPLAAAAVVERARKKLRRTGPIPIERMRGEAIGRTLIARWEEEIERARLAAAQRPELQNTDGDPLLFTIDHFAFAPKDRAEIERRLATMADPPAAEEADSTYVFMKPTGARQVGGGNTVIGTATVSGKKLRLESNSIARADALRQRLTESLGSLITHRAREHADPLSAARDAREIAAPHAPPLDLPEEEMDRVLREMKARHYADWADHPLPALGGQKPRTAVKTRSGRKKVDTLLKEMERHEARLPAGQRFDFNRIRRELEFEE